MLSDLLTRSSRFALAHAASPHWRIAAADCLEQLGRPAPGANLGFLYVTDRHAARVPELLELLRMRTGVEHWIGTVGLAICATGVEYAEEGAMAMMLGEFPDGSFRVLSQMRGGGDLARDPLTVGAAPGRFAIVHADPRNGAVTQLVHDLARRLDSGFVVGGLTSSRHAYAQIADGVSEGGLSGAIFTDDVVVATRLTQGCSPVGEMHTVTEVQRNVLVELDGRPALDVLREDAGLRSVRDLERVGGHIFAALPVAGSRGADYTVRNLVGLDAENGLVAIGDMVKSGSKLMFCRRDRRTAIEDMGRMLDSIKAGLYARPRGALYFSCLGRGESLFGESGRELAMIGEALGDVPLVGFFCNGEISHNRLYGYTGVLTLFV
ncbi:MAG: FIST C-terminal domain-containing protein [Burkholderiales bacterium]|jgi:small ligand-binding sensory domain FIST|nr:FIST C-terminal domain-containing protein [Burkholderiales bacterium]